MSDSSPAYIAKSHHSKSLHGRLETSGLMCLVHDCLPFTSVPALIGNCCRPLRSKWARPSEFAIPTLGLLWNFEFHGGTNTYYRLEPWSVQVPEFRQDEC